LSGGSRVKRKKSDDGTENCPNCKGRGETYASAFSPEEHLSGDGRRGTKKGLPVTDLKQLSAGLISPLSKPVRVALKGETKGKKKHGVPE